MTGVESSARRIDTSKPHPARVYDWLLDGKDNYPVDEELGRFILELSPHAKQGAKDNRAFMRRATRWLVEQAGMRQFLDIGAGIPTEPNLHQIAQGFDPAARVVYVDYDPIVLAHARALLKGTDEGIVDYVEADMREPMSIVNQARQILDFDKPIAVSMVALLHFISDDEHAYEHVRTLVDALPSGSHLVVSQLTADLYTERMNTARNAWETRGVTMTYRDQAEVERFFTGLEMVDPGVVFVPYWHPELAINEQPHRGVAPTYAGVGRKP